MLIVDSRRDRLGEEKEYIYPFCKDCELYECDITREYSKLKSGCGITDSDVNEGWSNQEFVCCYNHATPKIECGRKNVSDGIDDAYRVNVSKYSYEIVTDDETRWAPRKPVFISAQTGQGKNYFIENTLIPYVRELNHENKSNQKVLILSNRLALKLQVKNRLNGNDFSNSEDAFYPYGEFADVMTYQSVLKAESRLEWKQNKDNIKSRYIFVICDEAHFFTSDAMFNPHTQKILETIIRIFRDAVRVYMSATPYDCLQYIDKYENDFSQRFYQWCGDESKMYTFMTLYHFKRDYSYLDTYYYSNIKELFDDIYKSVTTKNEKWLIFIDDKEKCKSVKEILEHYSDENEDMDNSENASQKKKTPDKKSLLGKVLAVDATSKNDKNFQTIVLNEQLGKTAHVLISTSVLDNGINLTDIDNVVISDMSKVKCLQMLGRARVQKDKRKKLFLKRFNPNYIDDRIEDFTRQEDAYHHYELAFNESGELGVGSDAYNFLEKYYNGDERDWRNAKHWFGRPIKEAKKLYLNEIAKSLLEKSKREYMSIRDVMLKESQTGYDSQLDQENGGCVGQKYLEYQLSWFGKVYCVDDDITYADKDKAKKAFVAFLESHAENGLQIDKEEQQRFRPEFTRLYDAAFGRADPNKGRLYSIVKMNSLLEDAHINYKVDSHSAYWIVQEHDWETEEE